MKYKGYTAQVELDEEQGVLFGRVIRLRDVITFQAESVAQAIEEFHHSVDSYLEYCAQRGERPEKPYSGQFMLRIDPNLHRELASRAEIEKIGLNGLVEKLLASRLDGPGMRERAPANEGKNPTQLSSPAEIGKSPGATATIGSRFRRIGSVKHRLP
jgi:predicted HicB family RNase H-like nuclease